MVIGTTMLLRFGRSKVARHSPLPYHTRFLFFTLISKSDFPSFFFFTGVKIMKQFGVYQQM